MLRMCREHGFFRGEECPVCGDEGKFLMSTYELESLGRIMAGILRHFPERFSLEMDEEGFIDIYKLVNAIKRKRGEKMRWLRPTHVIGLVETDPKGRYQIEDNNVRATYGHSIQLSMSLPTDGIPERLYFPALPDEVEVLMKEGLHPHERTMVHLSKTWNDAFEAGSHREGPEPVVLRVDAESAQNNGIIIQKAGKTVFTVEEIPPDFLSISTEEDIALSKKEMEERAAILPGTEYKRSSTEGEGRTEERREEDMEDDTDFGPGDDEEEDEEEDAPEPDSTDD